MKMKLQRQVEAFCFIYISNELINILYVNHQKCTECEWHIIEKLNERDPVVVIHIFDGILKMWQKYKIIQVSSLS